MTGLIDWDSIEKEAADLLVHYLQVNTTNPPGNETAGAVFLKKALEREHIACEIIESAPGRGNLISRCIGSGATADVLLLHHIDVVPAEAGKWLLPPFSGAILDGEIWGRGAVDCKSLGIMELMAMVLLKRKGLEPEKKIIYAATADEEIGGARGVQWLLQHHPGKLRTRYVVNEGVGLGFSNDDRTIYLCQVAEKAACWTRITFRGRPGHASVPHDDNCVVAMARAVLALSGHGFPVKITPPVEKFLRGFAAVQQFMPEADCAGLLDASRCTAVLERIADPVLRRIIAALVKNTAVPTLIAAGSKTNVIPGECSCEVDCRILPGETPEEFKKTLAHILDAHTCGDYSIEMSGSLASESPCDTDFYRVLEQSFIRTDPKACMLPYMSPGATDSRFFRQLGIPCYGVQMEPSLDAIDRIHGHNERTSIKQLTFGIKVLYDTLKTFCYGNQP
jgi:acetylornithine deacetylase/succinyl-diaminopimelate desuccinylase-like protein